MLNFEKAEQAIANIAYGMAGLKEIENGNGDPKDAFSYKGSISQGKRELQRFLDSLD